jgi:hypothetical protein
MLAMTKKTSRQRNHLPHQGHAGLIHRPGLWRGEQSAIEKAIEDSLDLATCDIHNEFGELGPGAGALPMY